MSICLIFICKGGRGRIGTNYEFPMRAPNNLLQNSFAPQIKFRMIFFSGDFIYWESPNQILAKHSSGDTAGSETPFVVLLDMDEWRP